MYIYIYVFINIFTFTLTCDLHAQQVATKPAPKRMPLPTKPKNSVSWLVILVLRD